MIPWYSEAMKRIGVLSNKGGVGKSLVTMGLAQVLSEKGTVTVIDLDPAGTAKAWAVNAEANGRPLPYRVALPVEAMGLPETDFLVVDTPPNDARTLRSTAERSDFIFIPIKIGAQEVDRLDATINTLAESNIKEGTKLGLILNMMGNDGVSRVMRQTLEEGMKLPVMAEVKNLVGYVRAFGGTIQAPKYKSDPDLLAPFREALKEVGLL